MKRAFLIAGLMLCAIARADLDPQQESRYRALINELRCLVCQNQSIADSNAPLANDLRDQVSSQIAQGKSDREIVDYLTARYGDFVLYRPPVKSNTVLLWIAPGLLASIGLVMALRMARRRAVAKPPQVDQAKVDQLLRDVEGRKS